MSDLISRADAIEAVMNTEPTVFDAQSLEPHQKTKDVIDALMALPSADAVQGEWSTHEVACLLADMFGDTCACNYNSIDEWLPSVCEFANTECPHPVGVACWEQFVTNKFADMRGGDSE